MRNIRSACAMAVILFASSTWAQPNPFFGVVPYAQLREFLQLTDSQSGAIADATREYNDFTMGKQRRLGELHREIAQDTARSPLDPIALGARYAELETICREIRNRFSEVRALKINALTDQQKAKLKTLEDAFALFPTAAQAQSAHLLGPTNGPEIGGNAGTVDRCSRTGGIRVGVAGASIPGCGSPVRWIDTSEFQPAGIVQPNSQCDCAAIQSAQRPRGA